MKKPLLTFVFIFICHFSYYAQFVTTGLYHSFASCGDGVVYGFGRNDSGHLGIGNTDNQYTPVEVPLTDIVEAEAGGYFSMFRTNMGSVWVCGSNAYGNFGNGSTSSVNTTPELTTLSGITAIDAGFGHSIALSADGFVYTAGLGNFGQLGQGSNNNSTTFIQMPSISDVIDVAAGYGHCLMLKNDGTVWACGLNNLGQLGLPNTTPSSTLPVQIPGLSNIVEISAGAYYSLFLDASGNVFATGSNPNGQLGNGNNITQYGVVSITGVPTIAHITAGNEHSFFRTASGDIYGMGLSNFGQNGLNITTNIPQQVTALSNVISVAAFGDGNSGQSLFLTSSGAMWGCGSNGLGAIGASTEPYLATPTLINPLCGSFLPQASFSANITEACMFPDPCFDFENESVNATSYNWDFGHPAIPDSDSETFTFACYGEPGTYTITLTASNEFGSSTFSMDVTLYDIPEVTYVSDFDVLCVNDAPVVLSGGTPEGGLYTGPGVTDGVFDPSAAGVGNHQISYSYQTSAICGASDIAVIEVSPCLPPIADFEVSAGVVCILDSCIDVTNLSQNFDSLHWDLPGTEIGFVNNTALSQICFNTPGTHTITLSTFNEFNSATFSMQIVVYGVPEVTLNLNDDIACFDAVDPTILSGGMPENGTYSGPGVVAEEFDASEVETVGEYIINYTVVLLDQCQATASDTMSVVICDDISEQSLTEPFSLRTMNDGNIQLLIHDQQWLGSSMEILNSVGQVMSENYINSETSMINCSGLSAGIHFARMKNTQGQVMVKPWLVVNYK